jgi:hypothetical protein
MNDNENLEPGAIKPVDFGMGDQNDNPQGTEGRVRATGDEPRKQPHRIKKVLDIQGDDKDLISKTRQFLNGQRKVKIIVPSTESDKTDITPSINGYVYQIQRDKEVEVPYDIMMMLMDAKYTVYTQRPRTEYGPNGEKPEGMEMVESEVLRFPIQRAMV